MRPRTPPEVVWVIGFISVSVVIYAWSFQDQIAIRSEIMHEVTTDPCKCLLKFSALNFCVILQNRCNWAPCSIWEAYSNSIIKWYCLHVLSRISCRSKHWLRAGMHRIEWIMRVCILCSFCWCGLRFHTDQTQESVLSYAVCAADMMNVSMSGFIVCWSRHRSCVTHGWTLPLSSL